MNKANWAEHMLRDEWFQEMMEDLRTAEINKFAMSDYEDYSKREEAYIRLRTFELIDNYLESLAAQKIIDEKRIKVL